MEKERGTTKYQTRAVVAPLQTMREHADCSDVSGLRKVAQILELGKEKTGRSLMKEEIKAGLNTLWNDGAVAAVERCSRWCNRAELGNKLDYIFNLI